MEQMAEAGWLYLSSEMPVETGIEEEEAQPGDTLECRVSALNEWFESSGGGGAARVRVMAGGKRAGLVAEKGAVERGEKYLEIPFEAVLSRERALRSEKYGEALGRTLSNAVRLQGAVDSSPLAEAVLLCTYLLVDGPRAYAESLPRDFSGHPLAWDEYWVSGCEVATSWSEALKESRKGLREFVALCRCARDPELPELGRERYAWAYMVWTTRCIGVYDSSDGQTKLCFLPMVDMTNCAPSSIARCSRTVLEDAVAVMRSPVDVEVGAEIFENYGWANFDYFLMHGFSHSQPFDDDALLCRPVQVSVANAALDALLPDGDSFFSSGGATSFFFGGGGGFFSSSETTPYVAGAASSYGLLPSWLVFSRRAWRPRLCRVADMRFDVLPRLASKKVSRRRPDARRAVPPFDPSWPFDHFNALWTRGRNHAFLVAVALELTDDDLGIDAHPVHPEAVDDLLAAVAKPSHVSAAWRRLAGLARAEALNLDAASKWWLARQDRDHAMFRGHSRRQALLDFYARQRDLARALASHYELQAAACLSPPPYDHSTLDFHLPGDCPEAKPHDDAPALNAGGSSRAARDGSSAPTTTTTTTTTTTATPSQ